MVRHLVFALSLFGLSACISDGGGSDDGLQSTAQGQAPELFGINAPLPRSAPATSGAYRWPEQPAEDQVLLADGLSVRYLTRDAANWTDMMAFWPTDEGATHIITCVEGRRETIGRFPSGEAKYNPSVQRIRLSDGKVETILRGMSACDGIRRTAWGTILVSEERGDGGAYEILAPLNITEQTILDRATGENTDPAHIAKRPALPTIAWEGLAVLPNGVVIAGDELRPGFFAPDADGGTIYKFVPEQPRAESGPIASLNESPLAAGKVYALQVSCQGDKQQTGQGCQVGNAAWLPVTAANARQSAADVNATGYYRPEDLHIDPNYRDPNNPQAIRFCWAVTGNPLALHFGEVMCAVDTDPATADPTQRTVAVSRFVEGDGDFNSMDNLAFQPGRGNLYVTEDHVNGDVFACLPDGDDRDTRSDGCIKILSVKDSTAEPTGITFSPDGRTAYLSIQHSRDDHMPMVDGYATDDVLVISGFKVEE